MATFFEFKKSFVNHFTEMISVLVYLHEKNDINAYHIEKILSKDTHFEKCLELLDIAYRRQPRGLINLCEALKETGQMELAECLTSFMTNGLAML